jgi:hypothetical protein
MPHDVLRRIVERYTPTMLDVVRSAPPEDIARLAAVAGPLPSSYVAFLEWMGLKCPFLDGEELAYAPIDLLELAYEDPEIQLPTEFILIGIDTSGTRFSVSLRRTDGAVIRLSEYWDGVSNTDMVSENGSLESFLMTAYVRKTLVPSHPFHFAAAFKGDAEQVQELWRRVDEACSHFEVPYPARYPDFRFYGGNDFVIGVHQRPGSEVVHLHVGAVERSRYEPWYDLFFARWQAVRMPT